MEKNLTQIVSDGYNMAVESINDTHVVISIGGSRREFELSKPLAEQINTARKSLGCSPLMETDAQLINNWQSNAK